MRIFYEVVDTIEDQLSDNQFVNTVTYGDIFDVALDKATIYPLSHFIVNSVQHLGPILRMNISLLSMGLHTQENEHHVLNEQLSVITKLMEKLSRGDLYEDKYQLNGQPTATPFRHRFEFDLVGWEITFDVDCKNDIGHEQD